MINHELEALRWADGEATALRDAWEPVYPDGSLKNECWDSRSFDRRSLPVSSRIHTQTDQDPHSNDPEQSVCLSDYYTMKNSKPQ